MSLFRNFIPLVCLLLAFSCTLDQDADHSADSISSKRISLADQSDDIDSFPKETQLISYGISSGMCIGYCAVEFRFHSWGIEKINSGWAAGGDNSEYPDQRMIIDYKPGQYDSIYKSLREFAFLNGPEHIGCPGCNDGPAE